MTAKGCSEPLHVQFEHLATLADGWCDGEGTAYTAEFLSNALAFLSIVVAHDDVPMPYVYPGIDCYVQCEWDSGDVVVKVYHHKAIVMYFNAGAVDFWAREIVELTATGAARVRDLVLAGMRMP